MLDLNGELSAAQRVVLSVDTSDLNRAEELAVLARNAGASIIKQGLELSSAEGSDWAFAAENARRQDLDWIADTKADDISATVEGFMSNIVDLKHPPVGITMHTHAGHDSMAAAQKIAAERGITIFGVTELTSVKEAELRRQLGLLSKFILHQEELPIWLQRNPESSGIVRKGYVHMRASEAARAGIGGLVASAKELRDPIKSDPDLRSMLTLIPGTRSPGVDAHDQGNVDTPESAIANGADLLVIGREITASVDPNAAFHNVVAGIQRGLDERAS